MPSILVRSPRGQATEVKLTKPLFKIGKQPSNDLTLNHPAMSREHCQIMMHSGRFFIRDLNSKNGTFVNGNRIQNDTILTEGTRIMLGDFEITFYEQAVPQQMAGGGQAAPQPQQAPPQQPGFAPPPQQQAQQQPFPNAYQNMQPPQQAAPPPPQQQQFQQPQAAPARGPQNVTPTELKQKIHDRLVNEIGLRKASMTGMADDELKNKTHETIGRIIQDYLNELPRWLTPQMLQKEICDEALGLGPLEDLLADEAVDEIMVNNWDTIFVEKKGKIVLSDKRFTSNQKVLDVIRRILAPIGRRIDESSPMVDARLQDGSRVNAIINPLSISGPTLTIRKFATTPFVIQDLINFGSMTPQMAQFLKVCVEHRKNILISGGTGSGKTTLLNVVSSFIPENERIVTVEDAAELKLPQEHVVSLESRPPNIEGKGAITIRDLVKNCLRMRPDRIVVGECRGGEALDMLQAMNTGHDGSLTTLHANSTRDALSRLETLVLFAGTELPTKAIREQAASAVDIIIQQNRLTDGTRKIITIAEVAGMEGDIITTQDIFKFEQSGYDANGKIIGQFVATGSVPKFIHDLRKRGIHIDMTMFAKT